MAAVQSEIRRNWSARRVDLRHAPGDPTQRASDEREFLPTNHHRSPDHGFETSLRPPVFAEFIGQDKVKERLMLMVDAAKRPRRRARPRAACPARRDWARPPSPTSSPAPPAAQLHSTSGPQIEKAGDLAGVLTNLAKGRHPVHRRNPPPASGDRGIPLPGDGGLPARHHHRLRPVRPLDPAQPAALHPRRRHHPRRHAHRAAALALRARQPARLLLRTTNSRRSSSARPACSTSPIDATGALEIAARSRGTPRVANALLRWVRDYAQVRGRRHRSLARSPTPRWP